MNAKMEKYPYEKFIFEDDVHSLPADAWPEEELGKTIRFLRADLTCRQCDIFQRGPLHKCPHSPIFFGEQYTTVARNPACMAFVEYKRLSPCIACGEE